jgi:hypothetical protein
LISKQNESNQQPHFYFLQTHFKNEYIYLLGLAPCGAVEVTDVSEVLSLFFIKTIMVEAVSTPETSASF